MSDKSSSWKQKVDPCLDKIIKYYLQFLGQSGFPSHSGWILLEDAPYRKWVDKGMQGWIAKYERDKMAEAKQLVKALSQKKQSPKEQQNIRASFRKELFETLQVLPEESQEYYKRVFSPFYSELTDARYVTALSTEGWKDLFKNYFCDQAMLMLHHFLVSMENERRDMPESKFMKRYDSLTMAFRVLMSIQEAICILHFEKTIFDLMKGAKDGNVEAFLGLLQIDRTIIECAWAQKMIRKAQLSGDELFFRKMAQSMTKSPLENAKEHILPRIIIIIFWGLGLSKLDNMELLELLETCGLRMQEDPETFRKFVNRLNKSVAVKELLSPA